MTDDELEVYKKENPKGRKKNIDDGFAAPGLTLIQEKVYERRLGKSLSKEHNAKSTMWGKLVEFEAFKLLNDISISLESKTRFYHKENKYWNGMPDYVSKRTSTVGDIKCPWTHKSFCALVDACEGGLESFKLDSPEYYWQLVSNSILTDSKYMELVVFMPYEDELDNIKAMADGDPQYGFIQWALDNELPTLKRDKYYKNLNRFRWEVPKDDQEYLTKRVNLAAKELKKACVKRKK